MERANGSAPTTTAKRAAIPATCMEVSPRPAVSCASPVSAARTPSCWARARWISAWTRLSTSWIGLGLAMGSLRIWRSRRRGARGLSLGKRGDERVQRRQGHSEKVRLNLHACASYLALGLDELEGRRGETVYLCLDERLQRAVLKFVVDGL